MVRLDEIRRKELQCDIELSLCYFYLDPAYEKAFFDQGGNLILFQG
jgi:hypothetical protein